jgi:hypothetical protein
MNVCQLRLFYTTTGSKKAARLLRSGLGDEVFVDPNVVFTNDHVSLRLQPRMENHAHAHAQRSQS